MNQVAVTEEMRTTWAAQFASLSKDQLASKIKGLDTMLNVNHRGIPADQIDAATEMLRVAREALEARS